MRKKKLGIIALISLLIVAAIAVSFTLASYKSRDSVENKFATREIVVTSSLSALEGEWYGNKTSCEITINSPQGRKADKAIIRIAVIPRWIDENGKDWLGDTRFIGCTFSEDVFRLKDTAIPEGEELWVPEDPSKLVDMKIKKKSVGEYVKCEEQYFYYSKTIDDWDEENVSVNLFHHVLILKEKDLDDGEKAILKDYMPASLYEYYRNKTLLLKLKVEAVEANKEEVENAWGKTTGNKYIDDMINRLCE